jgi:hypothetical protein
MILATMGAASITTDENPIQRLQDNAQPLTTRQYNYMLNATNSVAKMLRKAYASKNLKVHINLPEDESIINNLAYQFMQLDVVNNGVGYMAKNIGGKNLWLATNRPGISSLFTRDHAIALRINSAGTGLEAAFITRVSASSYLTTDQSSMTSEAATKLLDAFYKKDKRVGLYDNPWVSMQEAADQSGVLVSERCAFVSRDAAEDATSLKPEIETGVYKIKVGLYQ